MLESSEGSLLSICLIGPYPPQKGGIATHLKELVVNLLNRGYSVQVVTWGWITRKERNVYEVPILPIPIIRAICFVLFGIPVTLFVVCRHRFDVIHAHYLFPYGLVGAVCGKLVRKPVVVTCHGSDLFIEPSNPVYKVLARWTGNAANHVIVVAEQLRTAARNIGIRKKVSVIPSGIDIGRFNLELSKQRSRTLLKLPLQAKILLFVGRLVKTKRVHVALFALKEILNTFPNVYLVVVGDGPLRKYLTELSLKINVYDHVQFRGSISYQNIPRFYRASDIVILPSESEGSPIVILEAMAAKIPVVASAVGGVPEIIRNEFNGILFNPHDRGALVESIKQLISSPSKYDSISQDGFKTAQEHDWKSLIKEIEAIYISTSFAGLHKTSASIHHAREREMDCKAYVLKETHTGE